MDFINKENKKYYWVVWNDSKTTILKGETEAGLVTTSILNSAKYLTEEKRDTKYNELNT